MSNPPTYDTLGYLTLILTILEMSSYLLFANMPDQQKLQTLLSMQRISNLAAFYHAQIWILHDIEQTKRQKHAPDYYE